MQPFRIPVTTSLKIEEFAGGKIVTASSMIVNGVLDKYAAGNWFVTQRPAMNIVEDASKTVTDAKGRGYYYWAKANAGYFVNNGTIYKGSYGAPLSPAGAATFSAGIRRVGFFEVGDYLVILDWENNEGWYIALGSSTQYDKITDPDFPPNSGKTLAMGGAVLNDALYVLDTDGVIHGSAISDPTAWDALNVISAEQSQDGGVALAKHNEQIVAFGTRSIEFFYDAANPVGSPLSPRLDVAHEIGMVNEDSMWAELGSLFFVGLARSGEVGAYRMTGFVPQKISTPDIDSFLTSSITLEGKHLAGSGFAVGGRLFYLITLWHQVSAGDPITPLTTLAYNAVSGTWTVWELMHDGIDRCPVMSWSESTATRQGEGILSNGDLVTLADDFNPQDLTLSLGYVEAGYVETGYVTKTGSSGAPIQMEVTHGQFDGGTRNRKFMASLRYIGTPTENDQTLTVSWSDESNTRYNSGRSLNLKPPGKRITRLGAFRQRNIKSVYAGTEQIRFEGLEAEIEVGHA